MIPPPYAHQLRCLDAMAGKPAFALLAEMGAGKTRILIEDWLRLVRAGQSDALLVIAPAGVYWLWKGEIEKWAGDDKPEIFVWSSGDTKAKRERLAKQVAAAKGRRVLLMNVEALSTVVAARDLCKAFLASASAPMLAVDESTSIKNPSARRTKAALQLAREAPWRRIMSGLVAPKSPLDLFSQFNFLNPKILGFSSFFAFRARYAILRKIKIGGGIPTDVGKEKPTREVTLVVGYRNVGELSTKIAPYSYRILKKDCLDLPPKIYERRLVQLTDEQARHYRQLKEEMQTVIGETRATAVLPVTLLLRFHQLVCGYLPDAETGAPVPVASNRLAALLECLDEHSGKAIIWAPYVHSIEEIRKALEKHHGSESVVTYYGATSKEDRIEAVRRFQEDPDCRFFVSNAQTGGKGITLTAASLVIYYANTWNLEDRAQSEDRAHRAGLNHSVTYIDLMTPKTVDERIVHALATKLDLAKEVTGDNVLEYV